MKQKDYVFEIQDSKLKLRVYDKEKARQIKALGGKRSLLSKEWSIEYKDESDLAQIALKLNNLGISFAGSTHGWPPSAILEELRDKGILEGNWKEIVWVKKGEYIVRDR